MAQKEIPQNKAGDIIYDDGRKNFNFKAAK
jgi:hypothetical protein